MSPHLYRAAFVAAVATASAMATEPRVLEQQDVQGFSVAELRQGDALSLRLRGLAFHSALVVDRVEQAVEGDQLRVRVLMALAKKGKSGSFDLTVPVPQGVRQVVFGDEVTPIWSALPN